LGSKNKLKRFRDNEAFPNVIQPTRDEVLSNFSYRGRWSHFFCNDHPIVLELGCGKGEYTIALAKKNPNRNYIGIDIKGARLWRGAKTALEAKLTNVAFVRTQIELIARIFSKSEVDEIWIPFPDPQIKYKRTKHRMINRSFLSKYNDVLKNGGVINLKTDSEFMHGYTLGLLQGAGHEVLYSNHDIYKNHRSSEEMTGIQTFYEKQFLKNGKAISYIQFKLKF